jgi:hypothetical protein
MDLKPPADRGCPTATLKVNLFGSVGSAIDTDGVVGLPYGVTCGETAEAEVRTTPMKFVVAVTE